MGRGPRNRNFNLGNVLVVLVLVALGVSFWVPYGTAARTARVEGRAGEIAALLLEESSAMQPLDLDDQHQRSVLQSRTLRACRALGIRGSSFVDPQVPQEGLGWPAFLFLGRHYAYQVTLTPQDQLQGAELAQVEVYAWPRTPISPAHTVFFFSETSEPAFTRNLAAGYAGPDRAPIPGRGRRRSDDPDDRPDWYRGYDRERWLRFPKLGGP